MGSFVNRGNGSFTRARKSQIYIDKTGLLKYTNSVMDTEQCYICVSRPRRFGKTLTAGMLMAYYGKGCDSPGYRLSPRTDKKSFQNHILSSGICH